MNQIAKSRPYVQHELTLLDAIDHIAPSQVDAPAFQCRGELVTLQLPHLQTVVDKMYRLNLIRYSRKTQHRLRIQHLPSVATTHPKYIIHQGPSARTELYEPYRPPASSGHVPGEKVHADQLAKDLTDLGRRDEVALPAEDIAAGVVAVRGVR
jgi:hypothetical protein